MGEIAINPIHNVHKKYRTMNLVNSYVFTPPVDLSTNTEIGGVSATISTPALLAAKLGISVGAISNFTIVGSDIKCRIMGNYVIPYNCFESSTEITYFKDTDNLVTSVGNYSFGSTVNLGLIEINGCLSIGIYQLYYASNIEKTFMLKNLTTLNTDVFYRWQNNSKAIIYIPNVINMGTTALNNNVFSAYGSSHANTKIYCHPSLATNNGGNPDGDIAYVISQGATVRYVTNFTAPNPVTTLAAGTIYNTAIQLNFTPPSSTNAIDYYELYNNGVFVKNITASGEYITGLTPSTSYNFTVIAVDIFYNKSVVSNSLSVSTNTTNAVPTTGLVSYYKLDSNSNDSYGSNNGTDTSVSYVSGKISNAGSFNGSSSNISIADNSNLSFTNGSGTDTPFSFSFWLKLNNLTDQWIINKRGNTTGTDEYQIRHYSSRLFINIFSSNNANYLSCEMTSALSSATQYYITATYDGSEAAAGLKIYINGVLQTTTNSMVGTYTGMPNGTVPLTIGKAGWVGGFYLNGTLDETAIYNTALTQTDIDLLYNSGNGITL